MESSQNKRSVNALYIDLTSDNESEDDLEVVDTSQPTSSKRLKLSDEVTVIDSDEETDIEDDEEEGFVPSEFSYVDTLRTQMDLAAKLEELSTKLLKLLVGKDMDLVEFARLKRERLALQTRMQQMIQEDMGYFEWVDTTPVKTKQKSVTDDDLCRVRSDINWERVPWSDEVQRVLKSVFKKQKLRPMQASIINASVAKQNMLVVIPTGGGKSLCYQIPAVMAKSKVTIVVSPLIALMDDQVDALTSLDISAVSLSGEMPFQREKELLRNMAKLKYKIVYFSVEKFVNSSGLIALLEKMDEYRLIERLVIDEAHLISHWSDFRPEYREIGDIRRKFLPNTRVTAVTATATKSCQDDIIQQLGLTKENCYMFIGDFNRPNLTYSVIQKTSKHETISTIHELIVSKYSNATGIIYCLSIRETEEVAASLKTKGLLTLPYHSQLSDSDKKLHAAAWKAGNAKIIVATVAFGMGIDKPDVRYVINFSSAKSIEDYHQQSGRAGRDGQPADCIVFYSASDLFRWQQLAGNSEHREKALYGVERMDRYCRSTECRRKVLLHYFEQDFEEAACNQCCDNCKASAPYVTVDITTYAKQIFQIVTATGGSFTGYHCINIWRGSKAKRILENRHNSIESYGSGKHLAPDVANQIMDELIEQGFIYETFKLSQQSRKPYKLVSMNVGKATGVLNGTRTVLIKTKRPQSLSQVDT